MCSSFVPPPQQPFSFEEQQPADGGAASTATGTAFAALQHPAAQVFGASVVFTVSFGASGASFLEQPCCAPAHPPPFPAVAVTTLASLPRHPDAQLAAGSASPGVTSKKGPKDATSVFEAPSPAAAALHALLHAPLLHGMLARRSAPWLAHGRGETLRTKTSECFSDLSSSDSFSDTSRLRGLIQWLQGRVGNRDCGRIAVRLQHSSQIGNF